MVELRMNIVASSRRRTTPWSPTSRAGVPRRGRVLVIIVPVVADASPNILFFLPFPIELLLNKCRRAWRTLEGSNANMHFLQQGGWSPADSVSNRRCSAAGEKFLAWLNFARTEMNFLRNRSSGLLIDRSLLLRASCLCILCTLRTHRVRCGKRQCVATSPAYGACVATALCSVLDA